MHICVFVLLDTIKGRHVTRRGRVPAGAYLVLQLHDELIYDVAELDMPDVVRIIKQQMEAAMTLSTQLPVKVKVGPSWGSLKDFE